MQVNSTTEIELLQRNAWMYQIALLKHQLSGFQGQIIFEYIIPRMGRRVDNIIIINDTVFVIEFKVNEKKFNSHSIKQTISYALDLKYFHKASHNLKIIPILICTYAQTKEFTIDFSNDMVSSIIETDGSNLGNILSKTGDDTPIDYQNWIKSIYMPTPTIVEAAQALYAQHTVENITRNDAENINLAETTDTLMNIIQHSMQHKRKSICFVTGVPGAGKTLAGINLVTSIQSPRNDRYATFLSGNGPLVKVLREALILDSMERMQVKRVDINKKIESFIQNIHHFRDDEVSSNLPPAEHIAVFDEAQRAWDKQQASNFMRRKRNIDFDMSEPEFLISVMNRHTDWAAIVCLIGGGQEINTGEAGIGEWFRAISSKYNDWDVYLPEITSSEYLISEIDLRPIQNITYYNSLHLAVSVRSFRSEKVSHFVKTLLDCNLLESQTTLSAINDDFMFRITRDLNKAKDWVKSHARGLERFGILASSGAIRLKADGLHVKNSVDPENWFLKNDNDVRSSFYLEDVATEFDVQGLEIDWSIVAWDAELVYNNNDWQYRRFRGSVWQVINNDINKRYLLNSHRVLLTRARQGTVIYLPKGDNNDNTRLTSFYDTTYNYFKRIGIKEL